MMVEVPRGPIIGYMYCNCSTRLLAMTTAVGQQVVVPFMSVVESPRTPENEPIFSVVSDMRLTKL
jgi:hypothetical protein